MDVMAWSEPLPEIGSIQGGDTEGDTKYVVDLVHLSRQTLGDRALEAELLGLFDCQAAAAVARLTGPGAPIGTAGADIAHMLKGSARAVGAFRVARAAGDVESDLRSGRPAARSLDVLAAAIAEARRTVAALLV